MNGKAHTVRAAGLGFAFALGALGALGVTGCSSAPAMTPMYPAESAPPPAPAPPAASSMGGNWGRSKTEAPDYDSRDAAAAPPGQPVMRPSMDDASRRADSAPVAQPEDRPGLGTQWGETRYSHVSMVSFQRADTSSPFLTSALYYNDEEGALAMSQSSGFRRTTGGMFTVAGGLVSVGLRDERGGFFPGFVAGSRSYAVGESGHRYTIVMRNNSNSRLEIVMSVDGLDVLDGHGASFSKRGYILDPRAELEVDGFRQTVDAVAAFRFGSVRGSYAGLKTGDTRNVGVIGIAVFNEAGTNPVPWTPNEVAVRRNANPFPGQFASPP